METDDNDNAEEDRDEHNGTELNSGGSFITIFFNTRGLSKTTKRELRHLGQASVPVVRATGCAEHAAGRSQDGRSLRLMHSQRGHGATRPS